MNGTRVSDIESSSVDIFKRHLEEWDRSRSVSSWITGPLNPKSALIALSASIFRPTTNVFLVS